MLLGGRKRGERTERSAAGGPSRSERVEKKRKRCARVFDVELLQRHREVRGALLVAAGRPIASLCSATAPEDLRCPVLEGARALFEMSGPVASRLLQDDLMKLLGPHHLPVLQHMGRQDRPGRDGDAGRPSALRPAKRGPRSAGAASWNNYKSTGFYP